MADLYEIIVTMDSYETFCIVDTNKERIIRRKTELETRDQVNDVSQIHEHEAPIEVNQNDGGVPNIHPYR